jgi:hypothetical protein
MILHIVAMTILKLFPVIALLLLLIGGSFDFVKVRFIFILTSYFGFCMNKPNGWFSKRTL